MRGPELPRRRIDGSGSGTGRNFYKFINVVQGLSGRSIVRSSNVQRSSPIASALGLVLAGVTACTTATPYQPATLNHPAAGGYSDQQIEANRSRVTFAGNSMTSRQTVETFLLYRAAQRLCINNQTSDQIRLGDPG